MRERRGEDGEVCRKGRREIVEEVDEVRGEKVGKEGKKRGMERRKEREEGQRIKTTEKGTRKEEE